MTATTTATCYGCDAQPPEGADVDRWAEKHAKAPGHAVVTAMVVER